MILPLSIIAILTVITINLDHQEKVPRDFQQVSKPGVYEYKYNCSTEGIKLMIHDQLEDQTIAIICKDKF